jgi:hypothetical protein
VADEQSAGTVEQPFETPETVGELAELYLGNILYAIELASLWLEQEGRGADAPFYRGIARKLAEAHGAAKRRDAGPRTP